MKRNIDIEKKYHTGGVVNPDSGKGLHLPAETGEVIIVKRSEWEKNAAEIRASAGIHGRLYVMDDDKFDAFMNPPSI